MPMTLLRASPLGGDQQNGGETDERTGFLVHSSDGLGDLMEKAGSCWPLSAKVATKESFFKLEF